MSIVETVFLGTFLAFLIPTIFAIVVKWCCYLIDKLDI